MLSGQQIILDMYNCHYEMLSNLDELEQIIKKNMQAFSTEPAATCTHIHENSENLSIIVFHEHGHVIVHTFPETGFASLDILFTVTNIALEKIATKIRQTLGAQKYKATYLKRGDFGKLNDMKPTIHKKTKAWRRVRNTSANVLRMIVTTKNNSVD